MAGLGEAWAAARPVLGLRQAVPDAFLAASVLVRAVLVTLCLRQGSRRIRTDLRDPVLAPFTSLGVITPVIPAVAQASLTAGRVVVSVFVVATVVLGGWLTGQWVVGEIGQAAAHPGYFLPTVAGGLVSSCAAAEVHLRTVAGAMFGIGILCPEPTLAIELAPPAVAGPAWFALNGGSIDLGGPDTGRVRGADGPGPAAVPAHVPPAPLLPRLLGVHLLVRRGGR
jgi:tellurite resistance protein